MSRPRGVYLRRVDALLTEEQIRAAWLLHTRAGLSIRELGRRLWQQHGYASAKSCAMAISDGFARMGFEARDRVEASVAASWKHGKSCRGRKDPDHRRRLRLERGEVRGVQCAAVKTRHGAGRGEQCQKPALAGSDYCIAHDPTRAAERAAILAAARARLAEASA